MSDQFPIIRLHRGKEQSLLRFHPWVFSGAIKTKPVGIEDGEIVEVEDASGKYLGTGHFQDGSIAVRLFSFEKTKADVSFWTEKIKKALEVRTAVGLTQDTNTNAYRLIYGEGDSMPGMIVDYYNGICVMQAHSIGMYKDRNKIAAAIENVFGSALKGIYDKSSETLPGNFRTGVTNQWIKGGEPETIITENGNRFKIDFEGGQKTGFFLDQRENRLLLGKYSKGRRVLNTFCYTGGFSIYSANGGAELVHSVDSSKKAIDLTIKNIELNGFDSNQHKSFAVDTFNFLKDKQDVYDLIVLDPPAFAKHHGVKHNAVIGYKRLNAIAIQKILPGGIIFTFSCSQVINRELFEKTILSAAIEAGRKVRILHHLSQPADHPVNIFHPEGEYLKGLVIYVE